MLGSHAVDCPETVWVLVVQVLNLDHPDENPAYPTAVFSSKADLVAYVEGPVARQNPDHPLRPIGKTGTFWRIGPDEDEGFFGHKPRELQGYQVRRL
jgi:hypothetical protein